MECNQTLLTLLRTLTLLDHTALSQKTDKEIDIVVDTTILLSLSENDIVLNNTL